jgi:hypothetical protein
MHVTIPLQHRVAADECVDRTDTLCYHTRHWQSIASRQYQVLGVPTWRAAEQAHGAAQLAEAPLPDEHGARLLVLHHLRHVHRGMKP